MHIVRVSIAAGLVALGLAPLTLAVGGCDCGDDEGTADVIVPPRYVRGARDVSGRFHVVEGEDAGDPDKVVVEDGTEADWLSLPCATACVRGRARSAAGELSESDIERCAGPEREADGRLHLKCSYSVRKSCNQGRI